MIMCLHIFHQWKAVQNKKKRFGQNQFSIRLLRAWPSYCALRFSSAPFDLCAGIQAWFTKKSQLVIEVWIYFQGHSGECYWLIWQPRDPTLFINDSSFDNCEHFFAAVRQLPGSLSWLKKAWRDSQPIMLSRDRLTKYPLCSVVKSLMDNPYPLCHEKPPGQWMFALLR